LQTVIPDIVMRFVHLDRLFYKDVFKLISIAIFVKKKLIKKIIFT